MSQSGADKTDVMQFALGSLYFCGTRIENFRGPQLLKVVNNYYMPFVRAGWGAPLAFVLDVSASGRFGSGEKTKLDTAAEICALLSFSAIQNNDKVGAVMFSDEVEEYIPPDKGRRHVLHVIRKLLFHQARRQRTDIGQALSYLLRVMKRRAIVFLLSDFIAPDFSRELALAARKFDLVALKIRDPREEMIGWARLVRLWDQELGEEVLIDCSNRRAAERFARRLKQKDKELSELFNRCGVDSVDIDTHADYIRPLEKFFRARSKRR